MQSNLLEGVRSKLKKKEKDIVQAVIRNEAYQNPYTGLLADEWVERLELFWNILESERQSAYSAFAREFTGKLIFFVRKNLNLRRYNTTVVRNILWTFS